ncbi:AMP-binding protein [uncultured Sulfitobacter sp.]|uniref:AMP-binding protein n=1 Tax=uncultured Sulfitobacter sp. TaxID=191468 RepID=UPI00260E07B2|nr:AMP-binding protein [uncultured Sulfitobacter sp.]
MSDPSVYQTFAASAGRWPDRAFLNVLPETAEVYGIDAGEITYAQALGRVQSYAQQIKVAGYVKGQRAMLLLENRPDYFLWWLAFNAQGLSVVPVNPDLRLAEMAYMIGHAEPVVAISVTARVDEMRAAAHEAGVEMPVIPFGTPLPTAVTQAAIAARAGDAEAALLYTSGTTGQPKGCILTNDYFIQAGQWYARAEGVCALNTDGERMITPLPIFHMNAMAYSFMAMVTVGGCLTALDRFHPRSWWASVRDSGATCLHYLGVMPSMLMGMPATQDDRNHSVRFGFGAGIDPELHSAFEERFGFALTEAWAMTETGAGAVICANRDPRHVGTSCIGWPDDSVEVRLVDEAGQDGDHGELLVRHAGPDPRKGFFAGYFKNEAATDEVWQDGWFHTGDIVRRASDGTMYFVDRKKNVIRRSGENIAAVEVESALARHPAIARVAVAAVPDEMRGDEVFACIVPEGPADAQTAQAITTWCLTQLAYYKAPGYIAFVESLPVTSTQKLQRATLKTLAAKLLDDPATIDTRHLKKRAAA